MSVLNAISKATEDMRGKVRLMVGRAILSLVKDTGAIQTCQATLLDEEVHDDVERIQEYGFTSVPIPGAEAALVFVGGNRDHGLVIAVDDRRYRMTGLKSGEVALYDDQGQSVYLTRDGIFVKGAGLPVTVTNTPMVILDAPDVVCTGDLTVAGRVSDMGGEYSMDGMRDTYNAHTHPETGSTTQAPNQEM
jgi:phage baseplate assembly protein V